MPEYRFRLVNVFTRDGEPLSGNPLCVFEDADGLSDAAMQALALQFNLSETTFLSASAVATARARIFTPRYEMPFAGHPTLGTAHVVRALTDLDAVTLELPVGLVAVRAESDRWTLTAPSPTWRELPVPSAEVAAALGLAERDLGSRPLWVNAGKEQLIVPLTSVEAVRRAAPRADAFENLNSQDGHSMAYVFAASGSGSIESRFFFPQGPAMLEDPATGSAAANLGGWLLATHAALPIALQISQGDRTGRPSTLYLNVDGDGRIAVGGDVVEIGRGSVTL